MNSMSRRHILLVNPWVTDFAAYDFWMKPLGLLHLAAQLRHHGEAVRLVDCMDRSHPALLRWQGLTQPRQQRWHTGKFVRQPIAKPALYAGVPRLYARYGLPPEIFDQLCLAGPRPEVILLTSGMTYWYPGVQQTIAALRRLFPRVPIVLGGIYATLCPRHAQQTSGADLIVTGEAESVIGDLLKTVALCAAGEYPPIVAGRATPNLDELPWPAFDLYPRLDYATILTSRGCPLRCTFCASRIVAGQYRWRAPAAVMAEMEWLQRALGVCEFAFYDDALLTNRDRHFLPLCEQIIARRFAATFHTPNGLQVKHLDATTAQLMWRAGFRTIRLAYESSSPERWRDMSRKVSNESFLRAVTHLQAAGFGPAELDAYVLMALPGQDLDEVLASMALVHSLGVGIRLAAFSPIPGTVDFARAVARGDLAAEADPLLTNNSILPCRRQGTGFEVYDHLARLAKLLNAHLRQTGRPLESAGDLHTRLRRALQEGERVL
ncbi:MAG: B12-binding domain-containing radical SAM protein [candidate division KSB1 bacterium]|nr:B12-binding domain-containing radical SAM protein [candidate division KSB1 bacterium]MDZ7273721.1 B12-binding domain-containing radical SAM protein [candidate division KSB1 bacterium]MDZ7285877.1 B12-binding domain-containing radical SAM protein [candidate division KSB1 bacterium]MDZ7298909.1 B12-binding domain-containing radical SAM protein [candidate division KSB1 bacterium]MDZ7307895.1 B12-binding domain-containing radical SAM protein [candidate division KSB1 bacterium]